LLGYEPAVTASSIASESRFGQLAAQSLSLSVKILDKYMLKYYSKVIVTQGY
jgi:hypothetical protein